jgi:hypothetical protein
MSAPPVVMLRRAALLLSTTALVLALNAACGVGQKRSGLPAAAQASIDNITSDLARGDYAKIYAEAADEWRSTANADESRANLERIRATLGNVLNRAQLGAQERENASGANGPAGRTLVVSYNTKFERADAIETYTLVERSGRWLLARYAVNSNALKQ